MNDVAKINTTQPRDWTPTGEQITQAGCNEPYPDTGRLTVVRAHGPKPATQR